MTKTLLSIGHGYSARALARLLIPLGWTVIGTTRSEDKARTLAAEGVEPMIWPGNPLPIDRATHVLTSVSPDDAGDPVLIEAGETLAKAQHLEWVGYLSTIGVYGGRDGGWVDETSELLAETDRGQARIRAEADWLALGLPVHIFRLAGIYGPDRGPFEKVKRGTARRIIKPGQYFSRIHVDDIAAVVHASIERPNPGAVYNVCDDEPAPPEDVIAHAAELLELPIPPAIPFEEAEMSAMARSFYGESKRVHNDRIKDELGVQLRYPDYRSGLAAVLEAEDDR
ncbi:SDR family NAD(P)-dependent oxidoreductase [Alphaproteobacteria bacterium GH1-50]|uniref:SDR family NAD(P)-dependent oxidoreductase n=1 Tax=Kangsaoukella pontilimi TaxID=2691042 RepID=A0A7C9IPS1_9RHOB|nr:SDR family oxidoreductase [Kangsaoukella pontilimi]MXQ08350.1 SDR family NAD(P)-dependent oxidoreductase [Kangsaoukella pontilimi]